MEIKNWSDLNLKDNLLRGIYSYGFENPSEIQKKAIKPVVDGNDVIAQAQSGSGKTGTFSISSLQIVDSNINDLQVLILAPTHELVLQICKVIKDLSEFMENIKVKSLIGGTSVQEDMKDIKKKMPQIIVGTVGRTIDMIKRKIIFIDKLELLVLDEADEMLSGSFKENIQFLCKEMTDKTKISIFSATLPRSILELTDKFMKDPIKLTVKKEELTLECIEQYFIALENDNDKYVTIKNLFEFLTMTQCIVFVNGVQRVNELYEAMKEEGFTVCCMHSNMSKNDRKHTLNEFRNGKFRLLLSSDLTARGIDIQQVGTVINFDVPTNVHTYLHRIGRGGRWGRKGLAINLITKRDIQTMKNIEYHYKISIKEFDGRIQT